ncbi:hypothetical protein RB595_003599 [Gaeumannomyces hyphopodioides]
MAVDENQAKHALVSSWFLGPRAENFDVLKNLFSQVLGHQKDARVRLAEASKDPIFITKEMEDLDIYKASVEKLSENMGELSLGLANHSVPFWSPRYNAHMNMDTTLSSIIGYMTAMMYNPNNVALEASPLTTELEKQVGEELCHMLGYPRENPAPWGHIACDGSVANLEAIWAIRNLKFYPFSLKRAIEEGQLGFLADVQPPFTVENCKGETKEFLKLTKHELLNLTPDTVLGLPTGLADKYSISAAFLQDALKPYLIQTTGKDKLEQLYGIKPGRFMISATKHYSWPKGGAISGIGSKNFVDVAVDKEARMSTAALRKHLKDCVENEVPIFGVVAIMGSTEHGACDPLAEIVQIRNEYQREHGVSFAIHCDAAWGGYFASTLRARDVVRGPELPYVPVMPLNPYTKVQLEHLKHADSITIDPHKSGYINYPAGGLCYRDGRMRYLVTWTSPIVFHEGDAAESMGVYGVEGSKPGAAVAAVWLTHKSLGLDKEGYGRLLGEAVFSCARLYCHWATMSPPEADDSLIVVPLIRLPSERNGGDVAAEKQRIRDEIIGRENKEIVDNSNSWKLMCELGGDLMINAFACNFKVNGIVNQDVGEANYLNQWIFSKLSVASKKDVVEERPLFLTSSVFGEDAYGECLETFKERLGLSSSAFRARGDMRFLVNVTMSPWPTSRDFMTSLANDFRRVAKRGVQRCVKRNRLTPDIHGFVAQGLESLFFVHIPMFNMANHRKQLVIAADLPPDVHAFYKEQRRANPGVVYTVANMEPDRLDDLLKPGAATKWRLDRGIPADGAPPLKQDFALTNIRAVVNQSMAYPALDREYPHKMPFYLYGSNVEMHLDHVLKTAPNAQISFDQVRASLSPALSDQQLSDGVVAVLDDVFERSLQPLPLVEGSGSVSLGAPGLSLQPEVTHRASVYKTYEEYKSGKGTPIATGTVSVGNTVFADWSDVNMDPAEHSDH